MANGIQKDLGKVTAYAYAKAAGYTGTEEQFQAIFNEFTEDAPGLIDRMDTAVARVEAAEANIDATIQDAVDDAVEEATASAVATANQAVTDAQAAQTAAEGAVTQANAAVTAAQAAQAAAEDAAEQFVLDRTLTDSGAAAPADLVGDLRESTKANGGVNILSGATWEIGSIGTDGQDGSAVRRIRTKDYIDVGNYVKVVFTITSGYRFAAVWYDADKTFLRDDYWVTANITITPPDGAKYLRLVVSLVQEQAASLDYANEITAKGRTGSNEVIDEVYGLLGEVVVSANPTGTRYTSLNCRLEAGVYFLHIDRIISGDVDSNYSWVIFDQPNLTDVTIKIKRNSPINIFFKVAEYCQTVYIYAGEGSASSAGDTFTYENLQIINVGALTNKISLLEDNKNIPYHELEKNPYQSDFEYFDEVVSTTHAHCVNDTELVNLANKYDHVAISNYHPSVPFYPIEEFFPEPLKYVEFYNADVHGTKLVPRNVSLPSGEYIITADNVVSSDTDSTTCRILFYNDSTVVADVQMPRGNNISVEFTAETVITNFYFYAASGATLANDDTFTFTNVTIARKITGVYDNFMTSPNAEHAGFPRFASSLHINSIGSFLSKETENNGVTLYETISDAINALQFPQMGGISINHPTYSDLTGADIMQLLEENNGIFSLEIYNSNCEASSQNGYALTQWDYVLARGKQIYGLAVPDHEVQYHPNEDRAGFGYCHVMVRAKTEQQILHAYSCGRFYTSIYNDALKFTNLFYNPGTGFTVETSASATIKFITANGVVNTSTGTTATYVPTGSDIYVRVEATDGTNTLYSNAVIL